MSLASVLAEIFSKAGGSWNWGGATWLGLLFIPEGAARDPRERER